MKEVLDIAYDFAPAAPTMEWVPDARVPNAPLNRRVLQLLEEFKTLPDNWDEEGAPSPDPSAILRAEKLVLRLQNLGQTVFHVSPGPSAEVMIDLREGGKSAEILFYPAQSKYVLFPKNGHPTSGNFADDELSKILNWLHA